MSNYRFDPLSDREFEEFCCDVLSRYLSVRIELFKSGKDSGIDGRFFSCGDVCIIQCKRYVVSQYNSLLRNLKKEVPKVKKLSPQRYILATACELSPANKKEIFDLFTPYIQNEADIFSAQDLLSFLDKPDYDDILKTHYKLWLTSTAVLNKIFNNAIIGRSQSELEIIIKDSSKYILTDDFNHALDRLKETHTAILTGAPGIGKTTLARLLAMHYVTHQDFEFYIIYEDISEIEAVWRHDRKQLFYFDDFLGKNYLEAVEKNLDTHIMSFINRVKNADNKRFILTSRTHIINRGLFLSQVFQDGNLQRNEYEVKLENLSLITKARILYSHIFHSALPKEFIDKIYVKKKYLSIVHHDNYNPRLISYITDVFKVEKDQGITPDSYIAFIDKSLQEPANIWENAFSVQLTELQRFLVILVFWNKSICIEHILRNAFEYIKQKLPHLLVGNVQPEFFINIRVAVRAVLNKNVEISKKTTTYSLFNPSIGDYLLSKYLDDLPHVLYPLMALKTTSSLNLFLSLGESKYRFNKLWNSVVEQIFCNFQNETYSFDYIFRFCYFALTNKTGLKLERIIRYIKSLNFRDIDIDDADYFLNIIEWFIDNELEIDLSCFADEDYVAYISTHCQSLDAILILNKIIRAREVSYPQDFFDAVVRNMQETTEELASNIDVTDSWNDPISEREFDERLAKKVIDFLEDNQLPTDDIDISECASSISAADYINKDSDSFDYEEYLKDEKEKDRMIDNEIEDIFYREEF